MKKKELKAEPATKKKKSKETAEWTSLKSGAMKHLDGKWYASLYSDGWYFYNTAFDNILGPYKTFEEGLKSWKN